MKPGSCSPELYANLMNSLRTQNAAYQRLLHSREYRLGSYAVRSANALKKKDVKAIGRFAGIIHPGKGYTAHNITRTADQPAETPVKPEEYFSDERIAVYTCIFGTYDHIQEPVCRPDNIDWYIITDQDLPEGTAWKKADWEGLCDPAWSLAEKNRYFKMHPDVLFPEYRYSVYLDGNIRPVTDLTPFIYRIGPAGIAFHRHSRRNCAYDELDAAQAAGRISRKQMQAYQSYLEKQGLPRHYGLAECNVIAREHHNETCRRIMRAWWKQFREHISRDQVSLPLILYKYGISVEDVTGLGFDVKENLSICVEDHIHQNEK